MFDFGQKDGYTKTNFMKNLGSQPKMMISPTFDKDFTVIYQSLGQNQHSLLQCTEIGGYDANWTLFYH